MGTAQLPPVPDFEAIEHKAQANVGRQTAILTLIGNLVLSWSNNESMFIYVLMVLLEVDEVTAAVVFTTLNTTRARIDLVQRLAAIKLADRAAAQKLEKIVKRFNDLTRIRNEFNHSMYALNEAGEIINPTLAGRFTSNLAAFMSLVEAAKHYPCLKKAWVEFLGEQPDPAIDRVEA